MQTTMALRAVVPRAEAGWRAGAARRMSVVRGAGAPPFRAAFAASPARQVVARDGMAPLESYADAPPLEVVPWSKETANTVNLTGTVGQLDVRRLASGKTKAQIRLAVRKPATDQDQESDWFNVEVWNELAEQVAEHAQKGARVVVSGKLVQEKWTDKDTGKPRTSVHVVAYKVAKLEPYRNDAADEERGSASPARAATAKPMMGAATSAAPVASKPAGLSSEDKEKQWLDLLYYPQNWFDNRPQPADSKRPDFKHKATDIALWLDASNRPGKWPWVADYMGHRGQDPAPKWNPPASPEGGAANADAGASPF